MVIYHMSTRQSRTTIEIKKSYFAGFAHLLTDTWRMAMYEA